MPAFRFIPVLLPGFPASNLASKAKEQTHGEDQAVSYGRVQQQTALGPMILEQYRRVFEKIYIFSPSINIDDGWIPSRST